MKHLFSSLALGSLCAFLASGFGCENAASPAAAKNTRAPATAKSPEAANPAPAPPTGDLILIGHYASMTGSEATFGVSTDNGIQLAIKELNAAGGGKGKKVRE